MPSFVNSEIRAAEILGVPDDDLMLLQRGESPEDLADQGGAMGRVADCTADEVREARRGFGLDPESGEPILAGPPPAIDPAAEWEGNESRRRFAIRVAVHGSKEAARPEIERVLTSLHPLDYYRPVLERGRHVPPGMVARRQELALRVSGLVDCGARQTWIAEVLDVDRRTVSRLVSEGRAKRN